MPDRRAHPRVSVNTDVWIGVDGMFTHTREQVKDISLGGAFIETSEIHSVGSILSLRLSLDLDVLTSTVIVRRSIPEQGIGVEFLDLSPECLEHLSGFLGGTSDQAGL